jgi:hypothetical protein
MKRRDLLNSLTMVAGGSLCSGSAWSQATTPFKEKSQGKLAVPVRTFIRKNGALFQPIEITLDNHGSGGVAVTRVAGEEVIVAWCKQAREFQRVSGQTESLKPNYPSRLEGDNKKAYLGS